MYKVILYLITDQEGVIEIRERVAFSTGKLWYEAHGTLDFIEFLKIQLAQSLGQLLMDLSITHPGLRLLDDLGKYQLYQYLHPYEYNEVHTTKTQSHSFPILARDVPTGTELTHDAAAFFRYWKGKDAVDLHLHPLRLVY